MQNNVNMLRNIVWQQHECHYKTGAIKEKAKSFHITHWWDFWHIPLKCTSLCILTHSHSQCSGLLRQQSVTHATFLGRYSRQYILDSHSCCNASLLLWMACAREITPKCGTTSLHEWIASGTTDFTQRTNSISNKGSSRILRRVECWCRSPKQLLVAYGTRVGAATVRQIAACCKYEREFHFNDRSDFVTFLPCSSIVATINVWYAFVCDIRLRVCVCDVSNVYNNDKCNWNGMQIPLWNVICDNFNLHTLLWWYAACATNSLCAV